jgi:hypothetical protein
VRYGDGVGVWRRGSALWCLFGIWRHSSTIRDNSAMETGDAASLEDSGVDACCRLTCDVPDTATLVQNILRGLRLQGCQPSSRIGWLLCIHTHVASSTRDTRDSARPSKRVDSSHRDGLTILEAHKHHNPRSKSILTLFLVLPFRTFTPYSAFSELSAIMAEEKEVGMFLRYCFV